VKLFIIGNGFDRGHGLATNYWDFRTYLDNTDPKFLYSFEQHYSIYPGTDVEAKRKFLWNELEANLANIDEDDIIGNAIGMDMGLESGDIGIYDTLYAHFTDEYKYIEQLASYLDQWVRTIEIGHLQPKTSFINEANDAFYITFNYTNVLETVYGVSEDKILHIHGSIQEHDDDPVLGHGNEKRINDIKEKRHEAENLFAEKEMSIYRVLQDYYLRTYKDINIYMPSLSGLKRKEIDEIIVIGHSLAGVDIPYFKNIDKITMQKAKWKVYYFSEVEKQRMLDSLIDCGIEFERIEMTLSKEFYNL
jgi:hypothetical protein